MFENKAKEQIEGLMLYKQKESILEVIYETVEVLEVVKPIDNFKATE